MEVSRSAEKLSIGRQNPRQPFETFAIPQSFLKVKA